MGSRAPMLMPSPAESASSLLRVLLIDPHALFRHGMRYTLEELRRPLDILEADHICAARDVSSQAIDLVLLSITYPELDRLQAVSIALEQFPEAAVVVLSGENDPALVFDALEMGALGFIPKASTANVLISALRLVLVGGIYLPRHVLDYRRVPAPDCAVPPRDVVAADAPSAPVKAPASVNAPAAVKTLSAAKKLSASKVHGARSAASQQQPGASLLMWPPAPVRVPNDIATAVDVAIGMTVSDTTDVGRTGLEPRPSAAPSSTRSDGQARDARGILQTMTDRQRQVLVRVVRGRSNKEIARELQLSESTIKQHLSSAFKLLGVGTRTQAVFMSTQIGLDVTSDDGEPALT